MAASYGAMQSNEFKIWVNYIKKSTQIEQQYPQQFYQYVSMDQWNIFIKSLNDVGITFKNKMRHSCYYNKIGKCCGYTWIILFGLTLISFIVSLITDVTDDSDTDSTSTSTSESAEIGLDIGMIAMYVVFVLLIVFGVCICRIKEKKGYYQRHKQMEQQCNIMNNRVNNQLLFDIKGPNKDGSVWRSIIIIKINQNVSYNPPQNQGVPLLIKPQNQLQMQNEKKPREMFVKMADGTVVKAQIIDNNNDNNYALPPAYNPSVQVPSVYNPPQYPQNIKNNANYVQIQVEGENNNNNSNKSGMTNY